MEGFLVGAQCSQEIIGDRFDYQVGDVRQTSDEPNS